MVRFAAFIFSCLVAVAFPTVAQAKDAKSEKPAPTAAQTVDTRPTWDSIVEIEYVTERVEAFSKMEDSAVKLGAKFAVKQTGKEKSFTLFAPPESHQSPRIDQIRVDFKSGNLHYRLRSQQGLVITLDSTVLRSGGGTAIYKVMENHPLSCRGTPTGDLGAQIVVDMVMHHGLICVP